MPDYKTGSYIMTATKPWKCQCCEKNIEKGSKQFVRVEEFGQEKFNRHGQAYRHKKYYRFHPVCALRIPNLTDYERELVKPLLSVDFGLVDKVADFLVDMSREGLISIHDGQKMRRKLIDYLHLEDQPNPLP